MIRVTRVTWVTRVIGVTRVTWVTWVIRVTTVTCVTRVTWVTCVTMMSGLLFSRMTRVFKYEDKLKNTNDSNKEKEIINSRAIYTRENKPRLSLAAAFVVRHKKNYLY